MERLAKRASDSSRDQGGAGEGGRVSMVRDEMVSSHIDCIIVESSRNFHSVDREEEMVREMQDQADDTKTLRFFRASATFKTFAMVSLFSRYHWGRRGKRVRVRSNERCSRNRDRVSIESPCQNRVVES